MNKLDGRHITLGLEKHNKSGEKVGEYIFAAKGNSNATLIEVVKTADGKWCIKSHEVKIICCDYNTLKAINISDFRLTWRSWLDNPIMDFLYNHEIFTIIFSSIIASIVASLLVLELSL